MLGRTLLRSSNLAMLLVLCWNVPARAADPISPWIENPANGHQYALLGRANWMVSEIDARLAGGHLVTINDRQENAFVFETFGLYDNASQNLWIGLSDKGHEGTFRWISEEESAYTNWGPGEPNNSGNEDYVAIRSPDHEDPGSWNDFRLAGGGPWPNHGVVEIAGRPQYPVVAIPADSSWLAIVPPGYREGSPITSVGRAFETANPGWNDDLAYDTSAWGPSRGWSTWTMWGPGSATPVYLRKTFTASVPLTDAKVFCNVDDDVDVYINGQKVISDHSGGATHFRPLDVTGHLALGENLIAVKAHDSYGVGEHLSFYLIASAAPALYWDEAGDGNWGEWDMATEFSRWVDMDGTPGVSRPGSELAAIIRTDTVTVAADRTASDLVIQSGQLVIGDGVALTISGEVLVEPGAVLRLADQATLSHERGTVSTLAVDHDATIQGDLVVTEVLSSGESPGTLSVDGSVAFQDNTTYQPAVHGGDSTQISASGDIMIGSGSALVFQITGDTPFQAGTYTLITTDTNLTRRFGTSTGLGHYVSVGENLDGLTYSDATLTVTIDKDLNPGDANLSGGTDLTDFNIWNAHKSISRTDWSTGDFNGDGKTDLSDFNLWNSAKFTVAAAGTAPAPTEVPEPATLTLLVCGLLGIGLGLLGRERRGRKRE